MKKKILFILGIITFSLVCIPDVYASNYEASYKGRGGYYSLDEAIANAQRTDVIVLNQAITDERNIKIPKGKIINLELNRTESDNLNFTVDGGTLNLSEGGFVGNVDVYGTSTQTSTYSSFTTDGTTINALNIKPKQGTEKAYGVNVDIYWGGIRGGFTVDKEIKSKFGAPKISIIPDGFYGEFNMDGYAEVTLGTSSVLGPLNIKSGKLTLNETYLINPDIFDEEGLTAANIYVESNKDYAGNIELILNNARLESTHGTNIVERLAEGTTETSIKNITIKDGVFETAASDKTTIDLEGYNKRFITRGTYHKGTEESGFTAELNKKYINSNYKIIEKSANAEEIGKVVEKSPDEKIVKGNINNDDVVDVKDARDVLSMAVGSRPVTDLAIEIADFNGNRLLEASDAMEILKLYVKKE